MSFQAIPEQVEILQDEIRKLRIQIQVHEQLSLTVGPHFDVVVHPNSLISSDSLSLSYSCTTCTFSYTQTGENEPPPKENFIDFAGERWHWHTLTREEIKKDEETNENTPELRTLEPWMIGKTYYYNKATKEQIWYHPRVRAAEKEKAAAEKAAADAKVVILPEYESWSVYNQCCTGKWNAMC